MRRTASKRKRWTQRRILYGDLGHVMQYIDLYLPSHNIKDNGRIPIWGTLFFVHSGAWGSGRPWMYQLVAPTFLRMNFAVVIVGYRTYPNATTIGEQIGDIYMAWEKCGDVLNEYCTATCSATSEIRDGNDHAWVGNIIMGHSSGAHVAMHVLVDWIGRNLRRQESVNDTTTYPWKPDFFVGLSGPYDISHHFDFEAGRGVKQISPMKAICGHTQMNV